MQFAQRVMGLEGESAYTVLARAQELERQGRDIIHLEIGEPDFNTPDNIRLSGIRAISEGKTRYNPSAGMIDLREALADDAGKRRGMAIKPSEVVVAPGAKPVLFLPTLALVEPGDEVIYPDPGFPAYEAVIRVAGGIPVPVPLSESSGFSLDLDVFDSLVNDKTKLIILNSPGNPTGGVIPLDDLKHIAETAQRHDCWVLSDEIYSRIVFDGMSAPSIATLPGMVERTVIVDGYSKTYSMTGWRLGFAVMPAALVDRMNLLLVHAVGCTAQFTQVAGLEAITGPQDAADAMLAAYQQRRDMLIAGLNAMPGVSCLLPQGTFYAFPNITALDRPAAELSSMILDQIGVALLPGTAFGGYGEGYLRICFTNSLENIERAIDRIGNFLATL